MEETTPLPKDLEGMEINYDAQFLKNHGFELLPGKGSRKYKYLVINHNDKDAKLYFSGLDQAYEAVRMFYLPKVGS